MLFLTWLFGYRASYTDRAAISVDKYLGGKGEIEEVLAPPEGEVKPLNADKLPEQRRVSQAPTMPPASDSSVPLKNLLKLPLRDGAIWLFKWSDLV